MNLIKHEQSCQILYLKLMGTKKNTVLPSNILLNSTHGYFVDSLQLYTIIMGESSKFPKSWTF